MSKPPLLEYTGSPSSLIVEAEYMKMDAVYTLLSVSALLASAFFLTRMTVPRTRVESALTFALCCPTLIVLIGYGVSACHRYGQLPAWTLGSVLMLLITLVPIGISPRVRAVCLRKMTSLADIEQRIAAAGTKRFSVRVLLLLGITVGLVAIINLLFIASFEPATNDAIVNHLTRMAYFIQHDSLEIFAANRWEQVAYPKLSTILFTYVYLLSGYLANATEVVQYLAYFVAMLAVYGITRQLGNSRQGSLFSALIFGLLTICIVEATSTQTDLLLTSYTGLLVYYLLAYRTWREPKYLLLLAVALASLLAVKATFLLVLPPLLLLGVYVLVTLRRATPGRSLGRHAKPALAALGVALAVITLPAGYWDNLRAFGDPIGPQIARNELTSEGMTTGELLYIGGLNFLRYSVENLRIDGTWPLPYVEHVQKAILTVPRLLLTRLGIDLQAPDGARSVEVYHFKYDRPVASQIVDDATLSLGVLGLLLVWPAVLCTLFRRRVSADHRAFALAAALYFVTLSAIILYDQFHGRFLTTLALFATPLLASWLTPRTVPSRVYLTAAVALGCLAAITTAGFHNQTFFFPFTYEGQTMPSTYSQAPYHQAARLNPTSMVMVYEYFVPEGSVVAIDARNAPEFLFFGKRLSRRMLPVRPYGTKAVPIPPEAEYLVFDAAVRTPEATDVKLCKKDYTFGSFYLRPLQEGTRRFVEQQQRRLEPIEQPE